MKTTIIKKIETPEVINIVCNKCGEAFFKASASDYFWSNSAHSFEVQFTYGSNHDGKIWKFDLCDVCLENLTENFQIPVEISDIFF